MSGVSRPGGEDRSHELGAYREPPNGDYVSYLDMLERRQLAQLGRAHAAQPISPAASKTQHASPALVTKPAAAEIDALMERLDAVKASVGRWGTAQIVAAVIGAVLVLMTVVGEGSVVTLLIGIGLLWTPARRLLRLVRELDPRTNRALIDNRFGKSNKA